MSSGGAERVISEMSNYWAKKGIEITIVTIGVTKNKKDFYFLEPSVKRVDLSLNPPKSKIMAYINFFRLLWRIRVFVKKSRPSVAISFINTANIIMLLALFDLKIKKIISDRTDPHGDKVGFLIKKLIYPLSSTLVIQTDSVRKFYEPISNLQISTIPNPLNKPIMENNKGFKFKKKTIVAIGRLIDAKGFDLLIEAFYNISKSNFDWNLVIFGEGKERVSLEKLIEKYNLKNRVFLPGVIDNPRNTIIDADIFVLSSRKEGFPNVLIEAMSVGLPCISFNCPSGPSEIIDDYKNGILVEAENINELQNSIKVLIESELLRKKLGNRAKQDSIDKFYIENIMNKWEKLL
jgi:glycosyltransferase involved in cell wall biosynthesis